MIIEAIERLRKEIELFKENHHETLEKARKNLERLSSAVQSICPSASGSWVGYQASLYFLGFQAPPHSYQFDDSMMVITRQLPRGWEEKTADDIIEYVATNTGGLTLEAVSPAIQKAQDNAKEIERFIETDILPLQYDEKYEPEIANLKEFLDKHKWSVSYDSVRSLYLPTLHACKDPLAHQQGLKTPPHVDYKVDIQMEMIRFSSISDFIDYIEKFIRKIEVISQQSPVAIDESAVVVVSRLCDRFHLIANQLQNRHDNRDTLIINDEYDVQDLLHALLSIHFDDIRPEEQTPSFAGGSSRMDFLLKREQIVIETKKTRIGLDAKKLRDELLLDIDCYRVHPNCRILICFVYDPESKIRNPRGIEEDLASCSTENLQVILIIRP
ncbi:MAG: hypothetical protein ABFC38_04250 [Methanospirillum sp.]